MAEHSRIPSTCLAFGNAPYNISTVRDVIPMKVMVKIVFRLISRIYLQENTLSSGLMKADRIEYTAMRSNEMRASRIYEFSVTVKLLKRKVNEFACTIQDRGSIRRIGITMAILPSGRTDDARGRYSHTHR